MAKSAVEKVFERTPAQPEQSIGAVEATVEGMKGAVGAFLAGAGVVWDAAKPMYQHGATEAAAAMFNGASGHVMYQRGTQGIEQGQDQAVDQTPLHGLPVEAAKQPEVQQQQDQNRGMEM